LPPIKNKFLFLKCKLIYYSIGFNFFNADCKSFIDGIKDTLDCCIGGGGGGDGIILGITISFGSLILNIGEKDGLSIIYFSS
jgi:hypothetical protein